MPPARKAAQADDETTAEVDPQDKTATIHERMVAVMAEVRALGKNERVTAGPAKFNFRGIDAVMNAVGPALRRHGVYVTTRIDDINYETVMTSGDKRSTACRVVVSFSFTGLDGDSITTTAPGESWDSGDKGTAKAMSVAYRTALLQALCLPTDEKDPDIDHYERAYEHEPMMEKVRASKTKEQVQGLWKMARNGGASEEQLAEIVEVGQTLPSATGGIEQGGGES